ncbi:hypothetical protein IEQ34_011751 [Dendrobium chrysotoxum]|uniref:Uncharacterized protein n=1 Tax=Dendrobium chrysotoxum TaxID=161865 RepID=A0AAV7GRE2_DENCH|nr:hypothetical protein IEQ34_011751 [Dendrobium chrysotoxum]
MHIAIKSLLSTLKEESSIKSKLEMGGYPPIEILEKGLVIPSEETPAEEIWLSNLDLLVARAHTPTVYFYRRPLDDAGFFSPEGLKAALARTLVPFYPLAGRLVSGADGRLCIRCTAEGALFVVARSEASVDDFGDFAPSDEIRQLLVPFVDSADEVDPPLVMFQLTFFRCGGVCLGAAVHHTAADGLGALHFVNSWARITHTNSHIPIPPTINRTLLRARSPPSITSSHIEYSQSNLPPSSTHPPFTSAILKLSNHNLSLIKTSPTYNNPKRPLSTFKAVVSHIWRSACKARGLEPSIPTRLYMTADARSRLRPPLPASYLGNAIFRVSAEATAREISDFGAAAKIDVATKRIDDEFVRSLIDYLEEKVDEVGVRKGGWVMPETDLWVISWLGLPIYEADFGWGKPIYMGRACLQFGGLVYIVPSSPEEAEGGLSVLIAMEEENMERFKKVFYEEIGRAGSGHL